MSPWYKVSIAICEVCGAAILLRTGANVSLFDRWEQTQQVIKDLGEDNVFMMDYATDGVIICPRCGGVGHLPPEEVFDVDRFASTDEMDPEDSEDDAWLDQLLSGDLEST